MGHRKNRDFRQCVDSEGKAVSLQSVKVPLLQRYGIHRSGAALSSQPGLDGLQIVRRIQSGVRVENVI